MSGVVTVVRDISVLIGVAIGVTWMELSGSANSCGIVGSGFWILLTVDMLEDGAVSAADELRASGSTGKVVLVGMVLDTASLWYSSLTFTNTC